MDKINVLVITPSLYIGGLEMVIAHICRYIDKSRFNVSICCLKELGSIGQELINEGYSITTLPKPELTNNNYFSWFQILRLVKKNKIHVVHSHTLDSLLDATLCKIFNRKLKLIHTFHFGNYPNMPKRYLIIEKICSRFFDKLVAVGKEQNEKIKHALNIKDQSLLTIWNGVPDLKKDNRASVIDDYRKNHDILIIGTVCTLIEQKGLSNLLDIAYLVKRSRKNVIFLIAGEGHLRNKLEEKAISLGLKDVVVFLGWIENAASKFIPYIDIFFLPSLWEAMSVVVLEAMESGRPVVVTNVGENKHVIENRVDGFITEPREIQKTAEILNYLIDNEQIRIEIGKKARHKVRTIFNVNKMVLGYQQLYSEMVAQKPK